MTVFRYLSKEILALFAVITLVLLVIFLSNEWLRFLSRVAAGRLSLSMMFELVLLSLPQLLGLLIPLGFFFALLVGYGRLYTDNEMTALFAGGLSAQRLTRYSLTLALFVAILAGVMSLYLGPKIEIERQRVMRQEGIGLLVDMLLPGRFQPLDKQGAVAYAKTIEDAELKQVFIAKRMDDSEQWEIVTAARAEVIDPESGDRVLKLYQGHRYRGVLGLEQFSQVRFEQFTLPLKTRIRPIPMNVKSLPSWDLWQHYNDSPANQAELQWRLSIPLMAIILALIAVPLCRVSPRQGRYAKIFPATLIVVVYANFLFFIRSWIKHGSFPAEIGLWGLHAMFLSLAWALWWWPASKLKRYLGY